MSNGTASSVAGAFSSFFNSLTPGQQGSFLTGFHKHLSQSDEMKGLMILDQMESNPGAAPMLMGALTQITNLPQQVILDVGEALKNPAAPNFGQLMTEAKTALASAVSTSFLGL